MTTTEWERCQLPDLPLRPAPPLGGFGSRVCLVPLVAVSPST